MQRLLPTYKPSLILTADWHLREDTPICYTGDFQKEQWDSVDFVSDLQKQYDCPVVHAGDLFHHWKSSPWLLTWASRHLPNKFYSIAGQHDLPSHAFSLIEKTGINTLAETGKIILLPRVHFGYKPEQFHYEQDAGVEDWIGISDKKILVWHTLVYQQKPFPEANDDGIAIKILKKYPQFDLIVTGDNHQPFMGRYDNRLLVNAGCLTRQKASDADHKPRVYLWYEETNTAIPCFIPIQEDVISREHISVKEERDERLNAFISKVDDEWEVDLSFDDNLERFRQANNVDDKVMEIIYKAKE
jgi:DNA repair exonuclease SbcCD nuclease subunit